MPRAEKAIETGDATDAIGFVLHIVEEDLQQRFKHALSWKNYDVNDVKAGREFVQAYIRFVVYSHHLFSYVMQGHPGSEGGGHHHA